MTTITQEPSYNRWHILKEYLKLGKEYYERTSKVLHPSDKYYSMFKERLFECNQVLGFMEEIEEEPKCSV